MTIYLDSADVAALATEDVVLKAAREAVAAEAGGTAVLPARQDVPLGGGFLRVMPAALGERAGLKMMTLSEGLGTRYLILLCDRRSGALLGVLDADQVTKLRTAATTAIAGEILRPEGTAVLGLLGSGFEATGHLNVFASLWPLERVHVYSPNKERREAFAARMAEKHEIAVDACDSAGEVCAASDTVVLATKATAPVVDGAAFRPGTVVLSIGSTRPDLRELDRTTLARARLLLVDAVEHVLRESGDIRDAVESGALERHQIVAMSDAQLALAEDRAGPNSERTSLERDLLVFKSVGTALQDLALATALVEAAVATGRGREIGDLAPLKPFAGVGR